MRRAIGTKPRYLARPAVLGKPGIGPTHDSHAHELSIQLECGGELAAARRSKVPMVPRNKFIGFSQRARHHN